ncbi:MAG: peptidylprolyl isomerase [Candidatus Saccharimonas sp.]
MKKMLHKLRRKPKEEVPTRITNDTVAQHRERILAGGRRFKYPVQYAKYRLVFNTLAITFVTLLLMVAIGWWQIYPMQNTSEFVYKVTKLLPLPVASVDGQPAEYQDYLVQYRLSEFYLGKYDEVSLNSDDGQRQLAHVKRQSLDQAERVAYAQKLAKSYDVKITDAEINDFIDQERNTVNGRVSQETYDASISMIYGVSPTDYRHFTSNAMLVNKVAFAVDKDADAQVTRVQALLKLSPNDDFAGIVAKVGSMKGGKVTIGQSGLVNNSDKVGGLRASEVAKLAVGEVSPPLKSTTDDGYYFVKVVDKTDAKVNFLYIHIPLTQFTRDFDALKTSDKIHEYIKVS